MGSPVDMVVNLKADYSNFASGFTNAVNVVSNFASKFTSDVGKAEASAQQSFAGMGKSAEGAAGGFSKIGAAATVGGIAVVAAGAAVGVALIKIGSDFFDAYKTIQDMTGATGTKLEGLKQAFNDLIVAEPTISFENAAKALGELNQLTGVSGHNAEVLAQHYQDLSRFTGSDLMGNIDGLTKAFNAFGVPLDQQATELDRIFVLYQKTGVNISDLSERMVVAGPSFRALNIQFDEGAALIANFSKTGEPVDKMLQGLQKTVVALSAPTSTAFTAMSGFPDLFKQFQASPDPSVRFDLVKQAVDRMVAAGTGVGPVIQFLKEMGIVTAKSGAGFAEAFIGDKFSVGELTAAMQSQQNALDVHAQKVETLGEKFEKMKRTIEVALEPLASATLDKAMGFLDWLSGSGAFKDTVKIPAAGKAGLAIAGLPDMTGLAASTSPGARAALGAVGAAPLPPSAPAPDSKEQHGFPGWWADNGDKITAALKVFVDLWKGFTDFISSHKTLMDGLATTLTVIGIAMGVAAGIVAILGVSLTVALLLPMIAVFTALNLLWNNWQLIWNGIKSVASSVWDQIQTIWNAIVAFILAVFIPAFDHFLGVVLTVWDGIQAAIRIAWAIIQGIWSAIVNYVMGLFIPAFNFLAAVASIVWSNIQTVISIAWTIIQGIWNAIVFYVNSILIPTFNSFLGVVRDVWDGIGGAISFVWNGVILPVFNAVVAFVQGPLTECWGAFSRAASNAWGFVRAVIGDVLRAIGGAVGAFLNILGDIADHVGAGDLGGILHGAGKSASGWGQGLASGGTVGSGFMTNGPRAIVGEGNPSWPEYVIPTDPKYRNNALALLAGAAGSMGMASGGKSGPCVGCLEGGGWLGPVESFFDSAASGPAGVIGNALSVLGFAADHIPKLPSLTWDQNSLGAIPIDAMKTVAVKALSWIADKVTSFVSTLGGGGGKSTGAFAPGDCAGWIAQGIAAAGKAATPSEIACALTVAMRESGCNPNAINLWDSNAKAGHPSQGLMQTIPSTFNAYGGGSITNPVDNVRAATGYAYANYGSWCNVAHRSGGYKMGGILADSGTILEPGWNLRYNGTGRMESLVPEGGGGALERAAARLEDAAAMHEEAAQMFKDVTGIKVPSRRILERR